MGWAPELGCEENREMVVVKMCEVSVTSLHRVVITDNSKVLYTFKLLRTYFKCLHQEK